MASVAPNFAIRVENDENSARQVRNEMISLSTRAQTTVARVRSQHNEAVALMLLAEDTQIKIDALFR